MKIPSLAWLAAAALLWSSCGGGSASAGAGPLAVRADDPWAGPTLFDFELVERSGRTVHLADLRGRPFVLDFVFTTCSGPCPRMSARMRELQDALEGAEARLVSFSVDPTTDTPQVLREYARRFAADPERWLFLTGAEEEIDAVVRSVQLARQVDASAPAGGRVTHATRFLVADGRGAIRGYYDGESDAGVAAAAARARWLAAHPGR